MYFGGAKSVFFMNVSKHSNRSWSTSLTVVPCRINACMPGINASAARRVSAMLPCHVTVFRDPGRQTVLATC